MQISIIGGTGDIGKGLALRWGLSSKHEIIIGSRDPEKAQICAKAYREELEKQDINPNISGESNIDAAAVADVVVLSVPPEHITDTIEFISDSLTSSTIVVSPAVSMARDDDGFHYDPPEKANSITEVVRREVPNNAYVVGAFHNLPADRLSSLDSKLEIDTIVIGDNKEATETVASLAEDIEGLRAIYGGTVPAASDVESITPLLINLSINNDDMNHLGVRFR